MARLLDRSCGRLTHIMPRDRGESGCEWRHRLVGAEVGEAARERGGGRAVLPRRDEREAPDRRVTDVQQAEPVAARAAG